MNKKTKIIASAAATIAMCASLAVGGTFALFTSESKVNVAINSGKVNVNAYAEGLTLYSPTAINLDGTIADSANAATESAFANGGTATIADGNVVTLERMTAGDKASFDIVVTNESNVTVQYQTKIEMLEGIDLFSGLKVTLEKDEVSTEYDGMTAYSQWATLNATGEVERTTVTIELPATAGNEYQDLSCKLAFTVNAVQGNAAVTQPEEDVTYLYNASDLRLFEKSVNSGNSYVGKTVKLMDDVNLAGIEWKPVGQTTGYSAATYFQGTFDGNGKTISNLTIGESSWEEGSNDGQNFATGFFGFIDMGSTTIKNVTFDNANVEGHHWVGVVAGYMTGTVSDVTVTNSTVTSSYKTSEADGDKAGGIVGYLNQGSITGCTVSDSTVTAVRDNGSVVGYSTASGSVTGNTAKNCTVYYSTDNSAQIGGEIAGKRAQGVSNNTANNVTVILNTSVFTAEQLAAALTADADKIEVVLANNIDLPIATLGTSGSIGQYPLGGADTQAIEIDLNDNNLKLTSTYMLALGATNSEATITVKNGTMSSYTSFAQTWNMYDIMFTDCDWVLDGVTFENAVAINNAGSTVTMNNVTINEVNDLYAIWVCAGTQLTMDGCTVNSAGRAIKISDQYVDHAERRLTKLTVKKTSFTSVKKAAILVGSTAGANITLENVDISGVSADTTNAVWVDNGTQTETHETYTDYADLVIVTGGTKINEP